MSVDKLANIPFISVASFIKFWQFSTILENPLAWASAEICPNICKMISMFLSIDSIATGAPEPTFQLIVIPVQLAKSFILPCKFVNNEFAKFASI